MGIITGLGNNISLKYLYLGIYYIFTMTHEIWSLESNRITGLNDIPFELKNNKGLKSISLSN